MKPNIPGSEGGGSNFDSGPVLELQRRRLFPPTSNIDKFQSVVLPKEFVIAKDIYVAVVLHGVEDFESDKFLQMGYGRLGGQTQEASLQGFQVFGSAFQANIDLKTRENTLKKGCKKVTYHQEAENSAMYM